jgi:malate:quinone-oxidoreductase
VKPLLLACFHLTGSPLGNIRIPPEKASSQQLADPPNLPGNVLQKGAKRGLIYFFKINQSPFPPMSVPPLDPRVLDGKRVILFGPFATFSTKFLKEGSYLDLLTTTTTHNVWPMTKVGIKEYPLVEYLAGQLMLSDEDRLNALKEYFPNAKAEDWRLWQAGQRVQIIKRDEAAGGVLKLGTEIVASADGTIAGLLGASPGASTAAPIMLVSAP